jgi:hypothetical protein
VHAVVVSVAIEPGQADAATAILREQIVPRVAASPGLVTAHWTQGASRTDGLSMVVFDTEENAEAAAEMARNIPMPPGVTMRSVEVRMVVAQA